MSNQDTTTVFGIFHRKAIPDGATPVADFDLKKYLGLWYDMAHLDFFWENADMTNVTAEYTLNDDGTVKVTNRAYDTKSDKWRENIGKAKFRGDNTLAALEVSFFNLAWAGYNVLSVDNDYHYALVAGRDTSLVWILSRDTNDIPLDIKNKYIDIMQKVGYDVSKLTYTKHDK